MSTAPIAETMPRRLRPRLFVFGGVAVMGAVIMGVALGPIGLSPRSVVLELLDRLPFVSVESGLSERLAAVLWQIRVPRVVLAGLVGGTLAIAGGAYQGVFRNPLADPYLLGVAAGAGLGATAAIVTGLDGGLWLPLAAFAGGTAAVTVTYAIARMGGGRPAASTLILGGIAVASFFTAVQTFVQQLAADTIREVFSWILGRLTTVGWSDVVLVVPFVALSVGLLVAHRRHLDVLAVGEEEAAALGLGVERARLVIVFAATLGTAAVVSVSGLIGFVGIVVPHAVRLLTGTSYRTILPLSFLGGAAFLIVADVVARTVVAPSELPIGVITAFVGAPFFASILGRARRIGW